MIDNIVTNPSLMAGYNTYILAFYTTYAPVKAPGSIGGPMDSLAAWTDMTDEQRTAQKKVYRDAGVRLTFTCFGGLETKATWDAADGSALGLEIANFAKQYLFDGVDIDYEAFAFAQNSQPEAIAFLVTLIQTLRQNLPSPYIISMSVTPTWMAPGRLFSNMTGSVPDQVMGDIDYIDGMYYWGPGYWDTCDSLFTACPVLAGTSVGEILTQGVIPAEKYLVGIPQIFANSNNKFSDGVGTVLGDCLATKKGQYGGVATWKYDPAYPDWIGNVRTAAGW
ncbi:MAG: hypothetical protein M1838_005629 [Thelocarpon superellum]|nr:MAG: hypothetical protein M1838_005629 [Thelocarpon superellum]